MNPFQLAMAALADWARRKGQDDIAAYLDLFATIHAATRDDKAQFTALAAEIQAMVDSGRDPTPAERQSVRDRRKQLSDQIKAVPGDGGG